MAGNGGDQLTDNRPKSETENLLNMSQNVKTVPYIPLETVTRDDEANIDTEWQQENREAGNQDVKLNVLNISVSHKSRNTICVP